MPSRFGTRHPPLIREPALSARLLLTDIDGTLLNDEGSIPATNWEALAACRDAQVTVALATGRRWSTTRRLLDRLQLWPWVDYAILNNGMVIQDLKNNRVLASHTFDHELALEITNGLASLQMDPVLLSHASEEHLPDVWYRSLSLLNDDFIEKNRQQSQPWFQFDELKPLSLVEILLVGHQEDLALAQAWLANLPVETALIRNSFYREWMLEITPKGFSKFSGATFLQNHLQCPMGRCMAIGDSANDLPLLRSAKHRVAMDNAPSFLKAEANALAPSNHLGGMGKAVMDWLAMEGA